MAGIDTSIYGQLQPASAPPNALLQLGQIAQLRNYQAQADAQQRALAQDERARGVLASPEFQSADVTGRANMLYKAGAPELAGKVTTTMAAANKDNREAAKTDYEIALKRFDATSGALMQASQNPGAAPQIMQGLIDQKLIEPDYAQKILQGAQSAANPAEFFATGAKAAISAKEQAAQQIQQQGQAVTMRGQDMTAQTAAAGQAVTMRGQNMTDARAQDANKIADNNKLSTGTTSLRKEFQDLPEVKNYVQALPAFEAIKDAASRNTPMSDINLVYGVAKLYDPTSVVREGEYATVANAPAIPERIKGWASYLAGGGKLTDETKRQILEEANGRMATFQTALEGKRNQYKDIAERSGVDPTLVLDQGYKPPTNRGSGAPAGKTAAPMERKTIGGVTYEKDSKGWYKVQ